MKKLSKHIAIVLLGIFIFPIFFQPIHIVMHNTHMHNNSFIEEDYSANTELIKHISSAEVNLEKHCLVCEYQFSTNNTTKIYCFECNIPKIDNEFIDLLIYSFKSITFSKKSPRAPPVFTI